MPKASISLYVKLIWISALLTFYLVFSVWYGGNGKPITAEEGAVLLERYRAVHTSPAPGEESFLPNVEELIALDDGKEFYAVNLEKLKTGAAAEDADEAYTKIVFPLLFKRAGHPVFVGSRSGLMLGSYGDDVDRVAVVRYRSVRDMIMMASEPAMAEGGEYKFAALEHTEVFTARPIITFVHVRFMLALILILLGWVGLKGLSQIFRNSA